MCEVHKLVKIYIVRHCEAAGNRKKAFQGHTDCDISEDGARQLEYLSKRFSDIHIDKAYSSPLIRARKTAEAAIRDKGIEVISDPHFAEINAGVIDGMPFAEIAEKYPDFYDMWDNRLYDFAPEGGESMREVYDRMWEGLNNLALDPENEGKTLLIASHGAATRSLLCHIIHNDIKKLCYTEWSRNTAVSLIIKDEKGFRIEFANDDGHLPEDLKRTSRLLSVKKEI